MTDIWNQRYAEHDYVYGVKPNEFYKQELSKLQPGKILFPAEGEGRNAVYAALQGWEVTAFDSSTEAKKKAEKLAADNGVELDYLIASMEEFEYDENSFDALILIFAHNQNREANHKRLLQYLKPGGTLILEGFSKKQIANNSGGPRNLEMLFSEEELKSDFDVLKDLSVMEFEIELEEGRLHIGKSDVMRVVGKK